MIFVLQAFAHTLIKSIQEKLNCEALEHQFIHLVEIGHWYHD